MSEQEDLFGGKLDRDRGLEKVFGRDEKWMVRAKRLVIDIPSGWEGTGQKIRVFGTPLIGPPPHLNAWGALISWAVREGYLVRTGKQAHAKIRASHARRNDVYRRT